MAQRFNGSPMNAVGLPAQKPATLRSRVVEGIAVIGLFSVLTCVLTYPQVLRMSTHTGVHYDTLFSIWRLAWIAHVLPRDPLGVFNANIFAPTPFALAYSDAMLLQGSIAAPLIWLGVDPVTAYNIVVLLAFVTAGVAMYALLKALTGSIAIGVLGGLMYAFQPYRYAHYPQLELLWTCWIPLALVAFHSLLQRHRLRDGVLLGVTVALQIWSCLYYALFLVTALAVAGVVALFWLSRREIVRLIAPVSVAVVVVTVVAAPYAVPYLNVRAETGPRSQDELRGWSPRLNNYLSTNAGNRFSERLPTQVGHIEGVLFPGSVAITLAVVGVVANARRHARQILPYAAALLVAFDLSLGSNSLLFDAARTLIPPYQSLRVSGRMFVIVSACLIVLAGYGAVALLDRVGSPWRRWVALILSAAVVIETLTVPLLLREVPSPSLVYRWLALQPQSIVLEWPVPEPDNLGDTHEPEYMYFSIRHWQRLANGYSGLYPDNYIRLLEVMRGFPRPDALAYLRRRGIKYVILHRPYAPKNYAEVVAELKASSEVALLMTDGEAEEEVSVFEVQ